MSKKFMIKNSNTREKTIDVLENIVEDLRVTIQN